MCTRDGFQERRIRFGGTNRLAVAGMNQRIDAAPPDRANGNGQGQNSALFNQRLAVFEAGLQPPDPIQGIVPAERLIGWEIKHRGAIQIEAEGLRPDLDALQKLQQGLRRRCRRQVGARRDKAMSGLIDQAAMR